MTDQTDRFQPHSKQPAQRAGTDPNNDMSFKDASKDKASNESNGSTGDQVGGQSSHSEKEMRGEPTLPNSGSGNVRHPEHPPVETPETQGGEDENSTEKNGDDRHLHEDQKSRRLQS